MCQGQNKLCHFRYIRKIQFVRQEGKEQNEIQTRRIKYLHLFLSVVSETLIKFDSRSNAESELVKNKKSVLHQQTANENLNSDNKREKVRKQIWNWKRLTERRVASLSTDISCIPSFGLSLSSTLSPEKEIISNSEGFYMNGFKMTLS